MFFIGICDDEELHRKHVKELCDKYFMEYTQEYKCVEFESGEEFLQFEEHKLHLLFLDIELGGMNGIEMLSHLEEDDNVWRVVFISSHEEMVFDTFGVKTLGFERKPAQYERIAILYFGELDDEKHKKPISIHPNLSFTGLFVSARLH
ncbi:MAG: response regulator [Lachnospiraceae bacterium]|nr:response regulator [Lachnospiraceae bacterium]